MNKIILINKKGDVIEKNVKKFNFDNIYKYCNFKKNTDFDKRISWDVCLNGEKCMVQLWSKNNGRCNQLNKYEFPQPIDKDIYYGSCVLIKLNKYGSIMNLSIVEWEQIYENLFGGFEDINSNNSESDELQDVSINMMTKTGYLKDDFLVEDIDSEDDNYNENNISELEEDIYYYSDE